MPDGTQTLSMKDALAAARIELEAGASDDATSTQPVDVANVPDSDEQAPSPTQEQPAADEGGINDDEDGLLASLMDTSVDSQNGSESGLVPGSDDFWSHAVTVQTVNGPETVSIRELSDGYLRQADYTKKTQSVADQSKHLDKASDFLKAFETDPEAFVRSLALQAGLIDESAGPIKDVPFAKIPTQEELDVRLEEMVNERVASDPRVKSAEMSEAQNQIDTEFVRLEGAYSMELPKKLRDSIVDEAIKTGSADLEGILTKRMVKAQNKSKGEGQNLASTARPGTQPQSATTPEGAESNEKPSMREAWQQSKVEAAQQ